MLSQNVEATNQIADLRRLSIMACVAFAPSASSATCAMTKSIEVAIMKAAEALGYTALCLKQEKAIRSFFSWQACVCLRLSYRITSKISASLIFRHPSLKLDKYFLIFSEGNPKNCTNSSAFSAPRAYTCTFLVCRDGYCSKP